MHPNRRVMSASISNSTIDLAAGVMKLGNRGLSLRILHVSTKASAHTEC